MLMDRESAFHVIESLRENYGQSAEILASANEAKTRLLIIDSVLLALGWSKEEFNPEEAISKTSYTDYLLKIDRVPRLIVEAKRIGYTFGHTNQKHRRIQYTLRYLRTAFGSALTEVIDQAEKYSLETRVPFALITNGAQWLLVQLVLTPGFLSLDDLRGIYFGNIFSDDFNYDLFWEVLFHDHVKQGSIESNFSGLNSKEAEYSRTLQSQYGQLQWHISKNNQYLQDFYYNFFDEIIDPARRKMLEICFVSNSRLDHYQGELQRTLRDTAPHFLENALDISPEERSNIIVSESGDQKGRVVLVTGSVGCGKTTLVHKVLVEARQDKRIVVLVIDLINEVRSNATELQLWNYIEEEWKQAEPNSLGYEELRKIFGQDLAELRNGPRAKLFEANESAYLEQEASVLERLRNDPEQFFYKCWRYYRQKNKGIVIFFDNVDRTSQDYQEEVYAFAHKLAHRTGITVVVTMREFTYFRGHVGGFLDVRASDKVFHLQTPNLIQVLAKRIRYVQDEIDQDHRLSKWRGRSDWNEFRAAVIEHAETLKRTFMLDSAGQDRLSIVESLAWHNVRQFLSILGQLHVKLGDGYDPWDLSEIIAALLTPPSKGPSQPIITNVFRPIISNRQCYFLKLRILMLMVFGQPEHVTRSGTYFSTLTSFMNLYGYHQHWTKDSITELVRQRYLECLEAPAEEEFTKEYVVNAQHSFRPSPLTIVMFERIAVHPAYLSLIGNDLPFHSTTIVQSYEETIRDLYDMLGSQTIEREAISLILESNLGKLVARYLIRMFEGERPPAHLLNYVPQIGATENKLLNFIKDLEKYADIEMPPLQKASNATQLPLFTINPMPIGMMSGVEIPIPERLKELRIDRSEQGPLILWALVALRKTGRNYATGTEITAIINEYLVDDQHRKEPNNISRALRSKILQSQPWLDSIHISPRKKIFGLTNHWQKSWIDLFGIPAPDF